MDDLMLIGGVAFGLIILFFVGIFIFDLLKNKEKYAKIRAEIEKAEDEEFEREVEKTSFHAEITNMLCGTGMVGSYRLPKSERNFVIEFKNDEGEVFDLPVSEEIYLALEVGMKGMLTVNEYGLESFELDGIEDGEI